VELAEPGKAWRSEAGGARAVFVPVRVIGEKHAEPSAAIDPDATVTASKIEITLPDGSSIRVGHDVSLVTLRRVVSVLRG